MKIVTPDCVEFNSEMRELSSIYRSMPNSINFFMSGLPHLQMYFSFFN